jgi:hypothetical protein
LASLLHRKQKSSRGSRWFQQEIVGKSNFQDNISRLVGSKSEYSSNKVFEAVVICENSNPHDANAVAIYINGKKVGFLEKSHEKSFRT